MSYSRNEFKNDDLAMHGIVAGILICVLLCVGWGIKNYCEQLLTWKENALYYPLE